MIAVVTVLAAFPLGYFMRDRLAAGIVYAVAYLWAFTFQTLYLQLDMGGSNPAFETGTFPWPYGLVALTILLVGLGLVHVGHRVRRRRRAGQDVGARGRTSPSRGSSR